MKKILLTLVPMAKLRGFVIDIVKPQTYHWINSWQVKLYCIMHL